MVQGMMASTKVNKNKSGDIISYRIRICLGRDEYGRQVVNSKTVPPPEGLTAAKALKQIKLDADLWEQHERAEYQRMMNADKPRNITLADFIARHWMPDHVLGGDHTPDTIAFYRDMNCHIDRFFGHTIKLQDVSPEQILRFRNHLNHVFKQKNGEKLSAVTVKHILSTLRNILNYATRLDYIITNPFDKLAPGDMPRLPKREVVYLSHEEAGRVMDCLSSEPVRWQLYYCLSLMLGLRRGECLALTWEDLDKEKMTIRIGRNITPDRSESAAVHIGETKTKRVRYVPLPESLLSLFDARLSEQKLAFGNLPIGTYIFCRRSDPLTPMYPTSPTTWMRRFEQRHGLSEISPHKLRDTAVTWALQSGIDVQSVASLVGHSDSSTTLRKYAGTDPAIVRHAVEAIERILSGGNDMNGADKM